MNNEYSWTKSSFSSGNGGQCIEWSPDHAHAHDLVPVRDSKDPHGPALAFEPAAWTSFIAGIKTGDFPG
ncbi:DUF397 domain-containing protein [Streptomyces zagrosensis]|uniref:DUF397 domain-containing protein n=1 Tax=Streptomyces zagrosensis TaxID=1042984 RepID=A0A7W9Q5I9_9ACTN|nr:DUF397 domain-containing protein [Streptomyces zagrosensis]MBB5933986.1 hypothetical protein [Streptomyces zagrosensis]